MREFLASNRGLFFKGILIWSFALGIPVYLANNIFSNYHLKSVLSLVKNSEDAMSSFNNSMTLTKTSDNCVRAGKRIGRVYCGLELNEWVTSKLAPSSEKLKTELEWQSYSLSTVEPFPFGGEFAEPIARYRDHMKAWIKQLSALENCETVSCASKALDERSEISSTFRIAEIAFENVLPTPSYFGNHSTIKKLFKN
ncbi:hypothetical protein MCEMRE26_00147 [Candidatus Nanopelagicaceae bacterium]